MLLAPVRLRSSVVARPSVAPPAAFTRGRWAVGPGRTCLSRSGLVCLAWLAVLVCRPVHASVPPVRVMLRGSALGSNPSSSRSLGALRRCLAKAGVLSSRPSRTSCTASRLVYPSARSGSHRLRKGGGACERLFDIAYFAASVDTPKTNKEVTEGVEHPVLCDPVKAVARGYGVVTDERALAQRWVTAVGGGR